MDEKPDRRGAPRGDQSKPLGLRREGTEFEGHTGNIPHIRNEAAANQVETLAGFGLPQRQISEFLNKAFDDQGYSEDTISRHYRPELNRGMAMAKVQLMQGAYDIALGRNVPKGVSADRAYTEKSKSIQWILAAVHDVAPPQPRQTANIQVNNNTGVLHAPAPLTIESTPLKIEKSTSKK